MRDLTVDVALEGDFAASYTDADNSLVIATDTMKNTVYAFAPEHLAGSIEAFGLVLARHFVRPPRWSGRRSPREHGWQPLDGAAARHPTRSGGRAADPDGIGGRDDGTGPSSSRASTDLTS